MDGLFSLRIFCQIAQTGNFSKAAENLDITTATASKHIQALEERLRVRLFHRNTRTVNLTEQGERYYQQCLNALNTLDNAESEISNTQSEPQGALNIVAPIWFANGHFAQWLAEYQQRYPKVQLMLNLKNRNQETLADTEEIALRVSAEVDENLIARKLGLIPFHFVASPHYLCQYPAPTQLDELAQHQGLLPSYTPLKGIKTFYRIQPHQWLKPAVRSSNSLMLHQLALAGMGIAFLPDWITEQDLQQGKLQTLLTDYPPYTLPLYAVYQNRSFQSPKIRSFIDFLVEKTK